MNEQERKIVGVLINEMAFEGTLKHFKVPPPDISPDLFARIYGLGIPEKWDGNTESYKYANIQHDPGVTEFENCYKCLRILRNNIVHANKAYEPDTPERLTELLDWAESFVAAVYAADSPFAKQARDIKRVMKTVSF